MVNAAFGELEFNIGWKKKEMICYFGRECFVTLKVKAYFEEDGITKEQEKAYFGYLQNKEDKLAVVERLLKDYADDAAVRFTPQTLLFERDGSYALLCDDASEPDEGIAVCLVPCEQIMSQDDYL